MFPGSVADAIWFCSSGLGRALHEAKMGAVLVTINSCNIFENYIAHLLKSKAFFLLPKILPNTLYLQNTAKLCSVFIANTVDFSVKSSTMIAFPLS